MNIVPTYRIRQVDFIVDVKCCILRHPLDKHIFFSLNGKNRNDDGTYTVTYDLRTFQSTKFVKGSIRQQTIIVPSMVKLDPEAMAAKFNLTVDTLPENDTLLHCDSKLFDQRKAGRLPVIAIDSSGLFVDWPGRLLLPCNDKKHPGLDIEKMDLDPSHTLLFFFYDCKNRKQIEIIPAMTTIPENIVGVELPDFELLDPYAVALRNGWQQQTGWFDLHPVQLDLKARTVPLEQTIIADLVRSNTSRHQMIRKKGYGLLR